MSKTSSKVFIKTYGCQMNDRDSQAVAEQMVQSGYDIVNNEKEADVILFNTCSVRDQAERKAMGKIGIVKRLLKKKPDLKIGVIGCMAQSKGAYITDKYKHVDIVVGTDQLHQIPSLLEQSTKEKKQLVSTTLSRDVLERLSKHPKGQIQANIAIMRGCNEYCTYCIVPFTRGQEKSRSIASILAEVEALVLQGVKEITYLGQNITAYGLIEARKNRTYNKEVSPFAELLRQTAKIEGIERIRFTSPHARYFNDDLIDTIASQIKICKSIHFPLQSGSNRILKLMRRRYKIEDFLLWVNKLKERVPDVSLTTDIIVGFPGETEEEFEMTKKICQEIDFDQQFIFRYSKRKNTPAANMPYQVSEEDKIRRNQILLDDLSLRLVKKNEGYVNKIVNVLVEGSSKRNEAKYTGRSDAYKIVIFDPLEDTKIGDMIKVKITKTSQHALYGSIINNKDL